MNSVTTSNLAAPNSAANRVVSTIATQPLFRPSKEKEIQLDNEELSKETTNKVDHILPPTQQPPTSPRASKFSFSFKAAAKPSNTRPNNEIIYRFNAVSQRREGLQNEDKDRRGLFSSVPTEPASSRAKAEQQRHASRPPSGFRKVVKIMKRPKERPTLPEDLASSPSIYYRAAGDGSVIGFGAYGKVFKAQHVYTKKCVALKRIRVDESRDGLPISAIREVKILQCLNHHNILKLREVMVEKNDCYMILEYLPHDLAGLLNHPSFRFDTAQTKDLIKQLLEGLDYLHQRGVLHRDIKTANILVDSDGTLKLADFGLGRYYDKHRQLDYTNRVITIWYRPPELLLGETQYGPAVDIWSAACVMIEILDGCVVFRGGGGEISQLETIYALLGTPTRAEWPAIVDKPWFELLRPEHKKPNIFSARYQDRVSPAALELLATMFAYDPARRPTASEALQHAYFATEEPAPRRAVECVLKPSLYH